ncbi:hypothetical protein [Pedobacter sp.]|uniref:hypothetical protein n=1 Tax=Pedobacter sp. TaxID=1411316 RepID=UPI00396CA430
MSRGYRVVQRTNRIIYFETFLLGVVLTIVLCKKLDHHWALTLVTFPVLTALISFSFFRWAIIRYVITIMFSMIYGLLAYAIGGMLQTDGVSVSVIFAFFAYFLSLSFHKDHFDFIRNSDVIEYEYN